MPIVPSAAAEPVSGWRTLARLLVAAVLLLGAMIGLGLLLTRVLPGSEVEQADAAATRWMVGQRTPTLDELSGPAAELGNTQVVIGGGLVAAVLAVLVWRCWRPALVMVVALFGEFGIFLTTAIVVARPRPPVSHLDAALPPTSSFPSGHTGAAICLYGAFAVLVMIAVRSWWRWLVLALAIAVIVAVALARIYRGAHFPTDVIASVLYAVPWLIMSLRLLPSSPSPAKAVLPPVERGNPASALGASSARRIRGGGASGNAGVPIRSAGTRTSVLTTASRDRLPSAAATPAHRLRRMYQGDELDLPAPGSGRTAARWARLLAWGRADLPLARLAEGHTDALAILAEAGESPVPGALYGVWAARSGGTGAELVGGPGVRRLRGTIRFCSGAHGLDRALVVAAAPDGSRVLDLDLGTSGVRPVDGTWQAPGMRDSDTVDVELSDIAVAEPDLIGAPGWYTDRPGFWWGGGGVAAVWLGGALGVLDGLLDGLRERADPFQLAHLGALHAATAAGRALLDATAKAIDEDPADAHRTAVWTVRAAVERCCREVLDVAPRAAGVAALTRSPLGQRLPDLGLYIRQHHGERDLAALGEAVRGAEPTGAAR